MVELVVLHGVNNVVVRNEMAKADVVIEQLIFGWYDLTSIEAMSLEKPVLTHIREDLLSFYINAGLLNEEEFPIIKCDMNNLKIKIKELALNRHLLKKIGKKSREFAVKNHSLESMGRKFKQINESMNLVK